MKFNQRAVTPGLVLRSLIFNLVFYLNLAGFMVLGIGFLFTRRKWSIRALQNWAKSSFWLLETIVGTKYQIRGLENIKTGAALIVGKHQSFWETFALLTMVDDPAIVLKRELTWIPFFGWFALKFGMIGVNRGAGATALRAMVRSAKEVIAQDRQILIFPEGTRSSIGAEPNYKPGAAALYLGLEMPVIPFGLNSGLYWPRRQFLRFPGTIIIEFGKPISPGLTRKEFALRSQQEIEALTDKLVKEGVETDFAQA